MIVPMKKASLIVLEKERKDALRQLRKLGVVQLEELQGSSDELQAFKDKNNKLTKAISLLSDIKVPKKVLKYQKDMDKEAAMDLAAKIVQLFEEKKNCYDRITADRNDLERLVGWGEVNPAEIATLAANGVCISLYEIPANKYNSIGNDVQTLLVNRDKSKIRFLVIADSAETMNERPAGLPPEAYQVVLPQYSTSELAQSIEDNEKKIEDIDSELVSDIRYLDAMKRCVPLLAKDIELENVYSGMGYESKLLEGEEEPKASSLSSVSLAWVTGFVPVDDVAKLQAAAKEQNWGLALSDPAEDEFVPTKLKNNRLVSVIYPLTDFLDVTPGYREFDISGWFLLFFCIFFAMIFGDAGYGALIALLGIGLMAKGKKATPLSVLISLLGVCTMVWGVCTCSWFGIETGKLPETLRAISFKPVSPAKIGDTATTNQQILCFILALAQLSIAHVKNMIKYRKTLKFFGDFGSLLELWGMFYVVLDMVVDSLKYPLGITPETLYFFGVGWLPVPFVAIATLGVGFVLNFVFANYEGSIGKSVLESCKNIISVILGVVNVFSDIVSYIRLWAVALAGAAISNTVNTMAGPMVGKLTLFIFGIILLVFGHGLNMMLNVLSVIVHGVRLNTLEFSTHLGMTWSGVRYRPFREDVNMPKEVRVEGLGKAVNAVGTMSKVVRV